MPVAFHIAVASSYIEKGQQVGVELIPVCPWQSMGCTLIDFQFRAPDKFGRGMSRGADRYDLIVAAMNDKGWYVELFKVSGKIGFRKRLNAVEFVLETALHALKPERIANTLTYFRTRPVGSKEWSREVIKEL